jgi:hypothetical protein
MGTYARIALAAVMLVAFAGYADAQYMSYRLAGQASRQSPEVNNYLSARYDHLLQVSPRFRHWRMWKECHTINLQPLHVDCIASFDQFEPVLPEYGRRAY